MSDSCHGCKKTGKTSFYHARGNLCQECGDKFGPKKPHAPSLQKMAEAIDADDPFMINESKLKELQGDGNFDWPSKAMKSGKGAHGGGTSYEQLDTDLEFKDLTSDSLKDKKKPAKVTENTPEPGEGETGEKPNKVTPPTGFKSSKDGLPKEKDKPGKVTKNSMEALDEQLDVILENIPGQYDQFGGEPSALAEPKVPQMDMDDIKRKLRPEVVKLLGHVFNKK
jgi:hypothetical protein